MARSESQGDVVVRLLEGRSERTELVLEEGLARSPVTMGTNAEWCVEARLVGAAHVMLAWSGKSLFVAATRGQVAILDGVPLGPRWTEVRGPGELRFGGARVSIAKREDASDATLASAHVQAMVTPSANDAVTCEADEARLRAALALSRDGEATCIVAFAPAEARTWPALFASEADVEDDDTPPTVRSERKGPPPLPLWLRPM